jgi:hypothetical protein
MAWAGESEDSSSDVEEEQDDRMFNFEVAKTNEQEENVTTRPGFKVS